MTWNSWLCNSLICHSNHFNRPYYHQGVTSTVNSFNVPTLTHMTTHEVLQTLSIKANYIYSDNLLWCIQGTFRETLLSWEVCYQSGHGYLRLARWWGGRKQLARLHPDNKLLTNASSTSSHHIHSEIPVKEKKKKKTYIGELICEVLWW